MNIRLYAIGTLILLLAAACSKTNYNEGIPDYGSLSFYNASYTLDNFLNNGTNREVWLPLDPKEKQQATLTGRAVPLFSTIADFRRDYPGINWRNDVPWVMFDHYTPGTYTSRLHLSTNDVVPENGFTFQVGIEKDKQYTYCISDSLGTFSVTMVMHVPGTTKGTVKLRLVQLCPDADSVNLRMGSQLLKGMQNLRYRSVSGYVDYPLEADSILKLRVFNAGDTLATIARADLAATPGQSYLLVLRNYSRSHQYTDAAGQTIDLIPNGALDIRKVE